MKKFIFFFSMIILLNACSVVDDTIYTKSGKLTWEENFNNNEIDSKYWSKIPRGKSDWRNTMSNDHRLFSVTGGKMILRGMVNDVPSDTVPHITGGIYTKDKIAFTNGRIEIKAKLNAAKGAWPAFWMLPETNNWPMGGEIDIMERLNYDGFVYQTIHSNYTYNLGIKYPKNSSTMQINTQEFNVYAVEILKDEIKLYVNGKLNLKYPRIKTDKKGQFPFNDQKFYLLLDMQLGGNWVGEVNDNDLPVEMEIDWVKFYSYD